MKRAATHQRRNHQPAYVALVLALLYLLGQYGPAAAHALAHNHHHHERAHSAEAERDPCHRRIFHADAEAGCQHPAHLAPLELSCTWPDHTLPGYSPLTAILPTADPAIPGRTHPAFRRVAPTIASTWHFFLRGPPALR